VKLLLGAMGCGKSTLARRLLQAAPYRLIVDPRAEHAGDCVCLSLADLVDLCAKGFPADCTVVCRALEDEGDYADYLFALLQSLRGVTVFIDEIDEYCSPHGSRPELRRLVNYQRHFGISLLAAARRAAAVHRDLTALANEYYLFRAVEPRDLAYLEDLVGGEIADKVSHLKRFEYIHVNLYA